jgi:hypothetical protein
MPDPSSLRDSTQIVLPRSSLEGVREDLEAQFMVTVFEHEEMTRIIGSPVVIKEVTRFLGRQGVNVP